MRGVLGMLGVGVERVVWGSEEVEDCWWSTIDNGVWRESMGGMS